VIPITSKGSKQPNQFAVCTALRTDYFAANSADECKFAFNAIRIPLLLFISHFRLGYLLSYSLF
jgi:hypothetical protein